MAVFARIMVGLVSEGPDRKTIMFGRLTARRRVATGYDRSPTVLFWL